MRVGYSRKFKKQYKKLPKFIRDRFDNRLKIFQDNPKSLPLGTHKLHGKFRDSHSINVTGDIRAVFDYVRPTKVEFVAIGSHSELYS